MIGNNIKALSISGYDSGDCGFAGEKLCLQQFSGAVYFNAWAADLVTRWLCQSEH